MRYLLFGLGLSFACLYSFGLSPAYSQTTLEEQDPFPSSEIDSFSSGLGEGLSPFDLIHGINSSRGMSIEEYRNRQDENLDSAASEFRQQQQRLFQEQFSPTSEEDSLMPKE